jgi:hypothetical protein
LAAAAAEIAVDWIVVTATGAYPSLTR